MGEKRNTYGILVGRLLERPSCKYVDNFKNVLKEIRWNSVDRINLA
jgi:hypothetical protein